MKVLVTGSDGFIGKVFYEYLTRIGWEVEGFEWDQNSFPDTKKFEWIIHCGAISDTTERDVDKIWKKNYYFTEKLLRECIASDTNIQISSSAAVYGPLMSFKESDPTYPLTPYAWSKYLIDKHILDNLINGSQILIQSFRYFNVYGPGEEHKGDQMSLVSKFIKQAQEDRIIKLFKDSENFKRDLICVYDVVEIQAQMLQTHETGVFNLGTGVAQNIKHVAEKVAQKFGVNIEYIEMPKKLVGQYQTYTCAEISKLKKILKRNRFISIEDYLQQI